MLVKKNIRLGMIIYIILSVHILYIKIYNIINESKYIKH